MRMKACRIASTRITATLMAALLAAPSVPTASAEGFLNGFGATIIKDGLDRLIKDPKLRKIAKEVTSVFPNAQVRQGQNGEAVLAAMLGALAVDLVVRAATSVERAEARRRGEATGERYRKLPQPESNGTVSSPERTPATPTTPTAPSKAATPKYVAIELPPTADASSTSSTDPAPPTRFMVYDIETNEVIGDRVYEAATRPKDEEKIRIGDREVTFIQASDAVAPQL